MKNNLSRNILCIKDVRKLSESDYFLYFPYKNIVKNFYRLSLHRDEGQFDFIYKEFNGINNAEDKSFYESFLGITSYFQSSKGGRGKYIEKKLCAVNENCCLNNKISDLPKLFLFRKIMRNAKLFGKENLNAEEKRRLRLCEWSFIDDNGDKTTDLCCIQGKVVSFLELKNRVDSGGTAARREIFDNKFKQILNYFIDRKSIFFI